MMKDSQMQIKNSATFPVSMQADGGSNSRPPAPPVRSPTSPITVTTDNKPNRTTAGVKSLTTPTSPTSLTTIKPAKVPLSSTVAKLAARVTGTSNKTAAAPPVLPPTEALVPPKNAFIDFQPPTHHIILEFPNTAAASNFHAAIKASIVKPMHPTWAYVPLPHGLRRVRRTDRGDMAFEFETRKQAEDWVRSTGNIGRLGVAEHKEMKEKEHRAERNNENAVEDGEKEVESGREKDEESPHKMGLRERALSLGHHERERRARTVYLGYLLCKEVRRDDTNL